MANAASTGLGPSARADVEQALLEHVLGAVEALLAGLEHEQRPGPASSARRATSSRAAPASIADVGSWPQACMAPSTLRRVLEPGVLGHRQRVHVAAQQDRRAGPAAVEDPDDARGARARRQRQTEPVDRFEDAVLGAGQVEADLGLQVEVAAYLDGAGKQVAGLVDEGVEHAPSVRPPAQGFGNWFRGRAPAARFDDTSCNRSDRVVLGLPEGRGTLGPVTAVSSMTQFVGR